MKQKKYRFHILLNGRKVGETWAVSVSKAKTNDWWNHCKERSSYTYTEYKPSDFEAVMA